MRVLVIGASGGIGRALVQAYSASGAHVHALSRRDDGLDLLEESTVTAAAERLAQQHFERIVVTTGVLTVEGVPPETAFSRLDPAVMARAYAINAIGPAMLLKHLAPLLPRDRPAVFALLSARLGSIADNHLGGWMSYRASKAALNQLVRCAAVELARKRPQAAVVALHPGTVPTPMTEPYARGRYTAKPDQAAQQLMGVMDALSASDSGAFFAYDGSKVPF